MIKVTIQLKSEEIAQANKLAKLENKPLQPANVSFFQAANEIYSKGGTGSFYKGLGAALLRQIFYTTTRLGVYKTIFAEVQKRNKEAGKSNSILI
jgi:solute carrier family 25 oxoglutarate transporter 11